ncbi:sulfur carrier protein ThiS [Azoarcus sp. KH32C]|uniref:sulfur carrier protein ThiS n=1 Tax=Azoarcus sp. KH32C TaxID=748247 RepID=UPI0002386CA6|nr:sulfur carrier protein ThiS [Azoarcus sp. KH32C]BAL25445.1 thiamine biosynthesis protein [Azoarcus sp. KH32C]
MDSLTIELNGAPHDMRQGETLHDLIGTLGLLGKRVAVAVNREVIPSPRWRKQILFPSDRVEVVVAIGGG